MDAKTLSTLKAQVNKHIGLAIQQRRLAARWSIPFLAELVGEKEEEITIIEQGNRSIRADQLFLFAAALNVAIADLVPEPEGTRLADFYTAIAAVNRQRDETLRDFGRMALASLSHVDAVTAHEFGIKVVFHGEEARVSKAGHEYRIESIGGATVPNLDKGMLLEVYRPLVVGSIKVGSEERFTLPDSDEEWLSVTRDASNVQIKPASGKGKWRWIAADTPIVKV